MARITRTAGEIKRHIEAQPDRCPVCSFTAESVAHYVDSVFYELVNDPPTREAIRKAGGFCRPHAELVAKQADALGTSLIFIDVLTNELRALENGHFDRPPNTIGAVTRILDGALPGRAPCPICREERGREELGIDSLLEGLRDPELAASFEQSSGVCLPHFRLAFLRCRDPRIWQRVLDRERDAIAALNRDLQELARKFDYRFSEEAVGDEAESWKRALFTASGWPEEPSP